MKQATITTDKSIEEQAIGDAIKQIIHAIGEDIARPGLRDTPARVSRSFFDLTSGYKMTAADAVGDALFPCESDGMVLQTGIEFFSLCEHHLLPFFGHVHVAYVPNQKIIGLSKIGRLIDVFTKRLQVQEQLTHDIAHAINKLLLPQGVAVQISANHFCMMMRGVKKQGAKTITTEFLGTFKNDSQNRADFLHAIKA
jgi:GTP cyclohydrolase I